MSLEIWKSDDQKADKKGHRNEEVSKILWTSITITISETLTLCNTVDLYTKNWKEASVQLEALKKSDLKTKPAALFPILWRNSMTFFGSPVRRE